MCVGSPICTMHNSVWDGVLFSYVFSILVMFNGVAFYWRSRVGRADFSYTGCLKKNAMEIQQAVVHHKLN